MLFAFACAGLALAPARAADEGTFDRPVGWSELRVVAPTLLELRLVTRSAPSPAIGALELRVGARAAVPARTGIRRRVLRAPLRSSDLRFGTSLLLELAAPLRAGDRVRLAMPPVPGVAASVWTAAADPDRLGPAVHASAVGYLPGLPKRAFVGFFAGTLGEMPAPSSREFTVERAEDGAVLLRGRLAPRPDQGMPGLPPGYAQVLEADFTALRTPGRYRLRVGELGRSAAFRVGDEVAARLARAFALGLYQQRCGAATGLPFSRVGHDACHLAPAEVATSAQLPPEARAAAALFPPLSAGPRDVSGGHHDAGDYGKYTIDSALLVHHLVLAADAFPGTAALDGLGLPESGDGVPDLVQLAAREASFLLKMQDDDGGFFFLVRPRGRPYEDDVPPDRGDPQVVFPKNTSATASATAALAQLASSPSARAAFPALAGQSAAAARRGWAFLQRAFARHGRAGAYRRITHYGDVFEDRDEVAWAATELFLLDGDEAAHELLRREFDPSAPASRRWGWWRLFEGYGAAARSYALAPFAGRTAGRRLDPVHLARCRAELVAAGRDQAEASRRSAYGTSYPDAGKRGLRAGWYFGENAVLDLLAAVRVADEPGFAEAVAGNLAYATGANPLDLVFVTGLGPRAVREVVHAHALNDRRALPPSGLMVGQLQQGLPWIRPHEGTLRGTSLPPDEGPSPYPIYDRYSETFNVTTEATVVDQARALAAASALFAATPLASERWRAPAVRIVGPRLAAAGAPATFRLEGDGLDEAEIVWEAEGREPSWSERLTLAAARSGELWVEAEASWPDGRRAAAAATLRVR